MLGCYSCRVGAGKGSRRSCSVFARWYGDGTAQQKCTRQKLDNALDVGPAQAGVWTSVVGSQSKGLPPATRSQATRFRPRFHSAQSGRRAGRGCQSASTGRPDWTRTPARGWLIPAGNSRRRTVPEAEVRRRDPGRRGQLETGRVKVLARLHHLDAKPDR